MSNIRHLDRADMLAALEKGLPPGAVKVVLGDCQFCARPVVIGGVMRRYMGDLPPTPNRGVWRAFERPAAPGVGFRSSKTHGFVPNRRPDALGFQPHECPRSNVEVTA